MQFPIITASTSSMATSTLLPASSLDTSPNQIPSSVASSSGFLTTPASTNIDINHVDPTLDSTPTHDPSASTNATEEEDWEARELDRLLPVANVTRIMKKTLPDSAKLSKEAKEIVQECVSEFISFITSEASDRCQSEKRKTITAEDVIGAMGDLSFDRYAETTRLYLDKFRLWQENKSSGKKKPPKSQDHARSFHSSSAVNSPSTSFSSSNGFNSPLDALLNIAADHRSLHEHSSLTAPSSIPSNLYHPPPS